MTAAKTGAEHKLEGTTRADRHAPSGELAVRTANVPDYFNKSQRALWDELSEELSPDLVDLAMLESVCIQIDRAREASRLVEEQGMLITINNNQTIVLNPAVKVERDAQKMAITLLNKLRSKYGAKSTQRPVKRSPRALAAEDNAAK